MQRFIKEYFDGSEGIGADVSYEGLKSWTLLNFQFEKVKTDHIFLCFELYLLHPVDICITKLVRYDEDDALDAEKLLSATKPSPELLDLRFHAYLSQLKNKKDLNKVRENFERLKATLVRVSS